MIGSRNLRLNQASNITMYETSTASFLRSNLKAAWLMVAALSLALPVFVPSFGWLDPFTNVIGIASTLMFVLSFPLSILAAPLSFLIDAFFSVNPQTIGGHYLNVCVMFVLGAIQWFWLAPKVWRAFTARRGQSELVETEATLSLDGGEDFEPAEASDVTPLEKVLRDQS